MSDVAAGSNAALQLQQNMAAAPYVKDNAAAVAEETQIKLQQDRLKASYAPQQMELKMQEDLQTAETNRLANLVASTSYKADTETTEKLKQWMQTDEGKKSTDSEKVRKAASVKAEAGLIKDASALLKDAQILDDKKFIQDQKKMLMQYDEVAKAASVINNVPEEQIDAYVNRLPEESLKSIVSQVGETNWKAMDGKTKRNVINDLMYNAKNHLAKEMKAQDLLKQEGINDTKETVARLVDDRLAKSRQLVGDEKKSKEERLVWNEYNTKKQNIERMNQKTLDKLQEAVTNEMANITPQGALSELVNRVTGAQDHSADRLNNLIKERDALQKTMLQKQLDLVQGTPSFPGRDIEIQGLQKQLGIVSATQDEPAPKAQPKAAASGDSPLPPGFSPKDIPGLSSGDVAPKPSSMSGQRPDLRMDSIMNILKSDPRTAPAQAKAKAVISNKQMSDEDKQALEWAKANPNDPRAAKIRARLGG